MEGQTAQLMARIEQQKQVYAAASSRKGQKARRPTREYLETAFSSSAGLKNRSRYSIRQTVVGYAYKPCTTPMSQLEPMGIDDLRLETHHRGRVLVVRTFGYATQYLSVSNAVEDNAGDVERMTVYNYHPDLQAKDVLPTHAIFATLEPYYKMTADGQATIRVDHPTDLVLLPMEHALIPPQFRSLLDLTECTPKRCKELGNEAYKSTRYLSALQEYDRGLSLCTHVDTPIRADLYRNRSAANLFLKRFESARRDALNAVITSPETLSKVDIVKTNGKAFFRAGCAEYQLRNFTSAAQYFQKALEISPNDCDFQKELDRCRQRLSEEGGRYDFESIDQNVSIKTRRVDHADFSTNVSIRSTKDRGRGLFAAKSLKAGDLVLVEKAFVIAHKDEDTERGFTSFIIDLNTNSGSAGPSATRFVNTVHQLLHSAEHMKKFSSLYAGEVHGLEGVHIA